MPGGAEAVRGRRGRVPALARLRVLAAATGDLVPEADPDALSELAAQLSERCLLRLAGAGPDARAALAPILAELAELYTQLRRQELADRDIRLAQCERGLARLRGSSASADLLDRVCGEVARSCGLERVLLSRIEAARWQPWIAHAEAADRWQAMCASEGFELAPPTAEATVTATLRPVLVEASETHPAWPGGGGCVIAPIAPAGKVIGLLHGDHGPDGPRCDGTDRDVLARFAQGFGHLYERTALLESMRVQQQHLRDLLAVLDSTTERLTESAIELTAALGAEPVPPPAPGPGALDARLAALTARERQVLELVAGGARNAEIAERLLLAEGTVKTHVKHILAKLGASNRSQVIAHYLGGG
ncbi:MAG: response regulator transcription factor [Sporichthyaceae bacterium]